MEYLITKKILEDTATNVRAQTGGSSQLTVSGMTAAVNGVNSIQRTIDTLNATSSQIKAGNSLGFTWRETNGTKTDQLAKCIKHMVVLPSNYTFIGLVYSRTSNLKSLLTVYIPSTTKVNPSAVSNAPFYQNEVVIYTDATSKPDNWTEYFNAVTANTNCTVHYGVSEAEYLDIVGTPAQTN